MALPLRILFTSVPVSIMPASNSLTKKYSCEALRLVISTLGLFFSFAMDVLFKRGANIGILGFHVFFYICLMYELRQTPFGSHTRYDIFHTKSGNSFSIVPACGANVLDIQFGAESILDGYDTPEALAAGKWGKSSILFPFPNRLNKGRYEWLGKKYQFPINNAATGNAIHGFVREESFEVEYCFLAKDGASIRCFYDYDGSRDYYPFPFTLEIEFTISNDGRFRMETEVTNQGDYGHAFRLWLAPLLPPRPTADAHDLKLPACEKVAINEQMIPTGERSVYSDFQTKKPVGETALDTCFQHAKQRQSQTIALRCWTAHYPESFREAFPLFPGLHPTPPRKHRTGTHDVQCGCFQQWSGTGFVGA